MDVETAPMPIAAGPNSGQARSGSRWADRAFRWLCLVAALAVGVLLGLVLWQLLKGSRLSIASFGWKFFTSTIWNPVTKQFGALPAIFGTVVSSIIALLIAVPL